MMYGFHPMLSYFFTLCSQKGHQRPDVWCPVYGTMVYMNVKVGLLIGFSFQDLFSR